MSKVQINPDDQIDFTFSSKAEKKSKKFLKNIHPLEKRVL